MAKKLASFFAVLALAMLVGACGKSPTGPTSTGGTPTPPEIKSLEFRLAPTGLGDPDGTPLPNPVTVGMRLQLNMIYFVNTGRIVTSTLRIYLGEKLVEESTPGTSNVMAGNTRSSMSFGPAIPGLYTAIGEVSDNLGTSTMQTSLAVVWATPGTGNNGTPKWSVIDEVAAINGSATWFKARILVYETGLNQTRQWIFRDANGVETEVRRTEVTTKAPGGLSVDYDSCAVALPTKPGVYKRVFRLTESWNGQSNTSEKSVEFTVP